MTNFGLVIVEPVNRELNSRANGLAKGVASEEYQKNIELVMMEDMTEGKGPERHYKVNMLDVNGGTSEGGD